jgi:hypothetical protein
MIGELTDSSLVAIATFLCQRDPVNLIPTFLERQPLRYVAHFLTILPVDCTFSHVELIVRLCDATNLDDMDELFASVHVLPTLIHRIEHSQDELEQKCFRSGGIWRGIFSAIPRCPENVKYLLINCLFLAAAAKLIEIHTILTFLDTETEQCPILQSSALKVFFRCLDSSDLRARLFPFLVRVAGERLRSIFPELIEAILEHYDQLYEIDPSRTSEVVHLLFWPSPADPLAREKLLLLLSAHPNCERVNIRTFCLQTLHHRPTDESVRHICSLRCRFSAGELDWFTPALAHHNFSVLNSGLSSLHILELLRAHFFLPQHFSVPLGQFVQFQDLLSPLVFTDLFVTLLLALECLNIPIAEFGPEVVDIAAHAIPWTDESHLVSLFTASPAFFADSEFGRLVACLLKFLTIFKKSITVPIVIVTTTIRICRLIAPLLGEQTLAVLISFFVDLRHPIVPVSLQQRKIVSENVKTCLNSDIPAEALPTAVRTAVEIFGSRLAYAQMKETVHSLIESDFEIAKLFAPELPLDLPPLRTFLAFDGVDGWAEWIGRCRREIPESEWIGPVVGRVVDAQVDGEMAGAEEQFGFVFAGPEVELGPVVHDGQDGTVAGVISFLWFSNRALNMEFAVLQEFVISQILNSKLVIGFLSYAKDLDLVVDVDLFAEKLNVDGLDHLSILSVALLLSFVRGPYGEISGAVLGLIRRFLFAFGFTDVSPFGIIRASSSLRGIAWIAIESILRIDPPLFKYFTPETVFDWALEQISGRMMLDDYCPIVSALSRTVFPHADGFTREFLFPPRVSLNFPFVTVFNSIPNPRVSISPTPTFCTVVDALAGELVVSHEMFQCLLTMKFDSKTTQRLLALIEAKLPGSPSALQLRSVDLTNAPTRTAPPSYFRAFLRGYFATHHRRPNVPYAPLHRALAYANSARINRDPPSGCPHDDLEFGIITLKTVMSAQAVMFADGALNQIRVFRSLLAVDPRSLMGLHAWKQAEDAKQQWAEYLIARALQTDAPCAFVGEVVRCLVATIGEVMTVDVVLNAGLQQAQNQLNVIVALKVLEKAVGDENLRLREAVRECVLREQGKTGLPQGFETEADITRFLSE